MVSNRYIKIKFLEGILVLYININFIVIGDSFVDVFSSRDTDSYVYKREADSAEVWLKSDKVGHIMRDNPYHGTPILGGMLYLFINSKSVN